MAKLILVARVLAILALALPAILKEVLKVLDAIPGDQKEQYLRDSVIPAIESVGGKIAKLLGE